MTLRHQKGQWPKEWVFEAGDDVPCSQGIDTQIAELNPILGRGGMLSTPLNKIRKRVEMDDDEINAFLKPCSRNPSSKRSKAESVEDLLKPCSLQPSSRKRKKSLWMEDLLRTCSPCKSVASSCKAKQQMFVGAKKRIRQPNERIIVNGNKREWKCPHCSEILDLTKGDSIDHKVVGRHLRQKHLDLLEMDRKKNAKLGRSRTSLGLRQLTWPVEFVKMKKEDIASKAQFTCPCCSWCLPKFPSDMPYPKYRYLMKVSKLNRIKKCKKIGEPMTLGQYNSLSVKKPSKGPQKRLRPSLKLRGEPRIEKLKELGHEPIRIEFKESKSKIHGKWMMVCGSCRSMLRKAYFRNNACKKKVPFKTSPGIAFWKVAESVKLVEETATKLGMDSDEVAHVRAALKEEQKKW